MNKTLKKTLSIILTILMIVTTLPMVFAADETPDFSDAKLLTSIDGMLYIDGVKAEINSNGKFQYLPTGKYKLNGEMETSRSPLINEGEKITLDLNGHTWNLADKEILSNGYISVYDTSADETGKIVSTRYAININNKTGSNFNLYSGTVETTGTSSAVASHWGGSNLYGGKIKSNGYAISYYMHDNITINLDGTVLETGEGYAQIFGFLGVGRETSNAVIDVTDYRGGALTADLEICDTVGKLKIFEGISAEDAEKYTVNVTCDNYYGCFFEKEEYDEATGEKYIYIAENAFTQQPSVENDYTVDFNNPTATFQWCEVEETVLTEENVDIMPHHDPVFKDGKWIVENSGVRLFNYDIKAGDVLMVSTKSDHDLVGVETGFGWIELGHGSTSGTMTFDFDGRLDVWVPGFEAENPVELKFSVIKETALDGETGKTLQNPECEKSYYCKATAGENVYASDIVKVEHHLVPVDAKAKTCTEIGWDAYEYCTACDYSTYEEIPATDHDWIRNILVRPTKNTGGTWLDGYYYDKCKNDESHNVVTGVAKRADYTAYDNACAKLSEYLSSVELTDAAVAEIQKSLAMTTMVPDNLVEGESSLAFMNNWVKSAETIIAKIESGEYVKVDGLAVLEERVTEWEIKFEEDGVLEKAAEIAKNLTEEAAAKLQEIYNFACSLNGSVTENAENIAKIEAYADEFCGQIENCIYDIHNGLVYGVIEEAECEKNAVEAATCTFCGAIVEREVSDSALTHKDEDGDYLCDHGCGHEFEKPVEPTPDVPDTPDEPADDTCDHLCHKDGILGFFWKIACFFFRLFNLQQYCDCGEIHYDAPIFG